MTAAVLIPCLLVIIFLILWVVAKNKLKSSENNAEDLQEKNSNLESKKNMLEGDRDRVQKDLREANVKNKSLQEEKKTMFSDIQTFKKEISDLKNGKEVKKLKQEVSDLKATEQSLIKYKNEQKGLFQSAQKEVRSLKGQIANAWKEIPDEHKMDGEERRTLRGAFDHYTDHLKDVVKIQEEEITRLSKLPRAKAPEKPKRIETEKGSNMTAPKPKRRRK